MVQDVVVEYYGAMSPINQVANVSVPDAMTICIQPWIDQRLTPLKKRLSILTFGFAPSNNGDTIILNVPPLTEERRRDLAKTSERKPSRPK